MSDIETVKIVVVGDSGVGKTSLVHLICQNEPCAKPSWTIGCSVDVRIHEFREGLPEQRTYCVELWDVGGSAAHTNTRRVFYGGAHGVILVHDLSNRKTQNTLAGWLAEVLSREAGDAASFDPETFAGSASAQLPVLVVASKPDLAEQRRAAHLQRQASRFADECGAQEITVDCLSARSLAAGSSNAVKLSRFFDKVIERRYHREPAVQQWERRRPGPLGPPVRHSYRDY